MEDLNKLVEDIYKHTGQKVEVNDPIVSAAFLQSRLFQDAINTLKQDLPQEISKKAVENFKQDIIDVKGELIYMSNNHKQELEKLSTKITEYITSNVNKSLDNNSALITNSINNNIYALLGFGLFCGIIGGMVVYLAKFFIA